MIRALLFWLLLFGPAFASEGIVAGLSQNRVSITADFNGSEILIYGAVKRDAPAPKGQMHVIITVEGPKTPIIVRKKARRFGIYVNDESVQIKSAPSFYAVATTGRLAETLSETENLRHRITLPLVIRPVGISAQAEDAPDFVAAMIRVREKEGRYRLVERSVQFTEATLFRADIDLPANLSEGLYGVRVFLTRNGQVVDRFDQQINVRKAGLERVLFNMSREQPLLYGLLSLLIAVVAGWAASALFRQMKR